MKIRQAQSGDIPALLDIWNPVIRTSVATFNDAEKTPAMLAADIATKSAAGYPFLVAEQPDGTLAGFATYGQFRASNGYRHTMEHTIILAPDQGGRGTGRALMTAIETHARDRGVHSLFAGVSGENTAGIAFHARLGYHEVARLPEVGRKFDRWFDLVLMQKIL
jgi:L-amino acid N-acyltransferase YncA